MGIFGLLRSGLGFLGGNWIRIALIAGLAAAIFGMGYMKASAVHAEHEADVQKEITAAISAREKELNDEHAVRLKEEEAARDVLQDDFDVVRDHRDSLIEGIRNAQLTKPVAEVRVEECLETDGESDVQVVVANPFSADFVRLWNDAGSDPARTGSETGPETD